MSPALASPRAQALHATACAEEAAVVRVFTGFDAAEGFWRALEPRARCYAFQAFDWLRLWQACVGESDRIRPRLVAVESRRGEPWLLMPLGLRSRRSGTALVWLGGAISDYQAPLLAEACPPELLGSGFLGLWRRVAESLPFDYLHFERQPATIGGVANPFLQLPHAPSASRSHQTRLAADWESYYGAKRSKKTIATHRRRVRQLEEHGQVEVIDPGSAAEANALLDTLFAWKSRRYQEMGVRDLFACERHRQLVRRLTLETDLVSLSGLKVGDRLWAAQWGLRHRDRYYWLFPAYESGELTRLSPGSLLLRRTMERCAGQVEVFDFTVGDEPYKDEWCELEMPLFDSLLARSLRGRAAAGIQRARLALKRRIKASRAWPRLVELRARLLGRPGAPIPEVRA